MNVTTIRCSQANETSRHIMTRHVRHSFTPDNQTNRKLFISCKQFVKCNHFNPIHVATKRELIGLLQQSISFRIDLLYILVHFPKFSLINFVALNTEKSSSFHKIILEKQKQTKHLIVLIYNQVYFLLIEIRYFILLAINTHIDCANNSKCSVRYIPKATARSLESVLLKHFLLD